MSEVNSAAERLLLSALIRHPDIFFQFSDHLSEDDFSYAGNKATYSTLKSLYLNKDVNSVSKEKLNAEAKALGFENFQSITNNGKLLDDLLSQNVLAEEVNHLFLEVKKCTLIRNYKATFETLEGDFKNYTGSVTELIAKVEDEIIGKVNLLDKGEHAITSLGATAKDIIYDLAKDPGNLGVDIGFPIWQHRCGEIRNGSVTLLVGTTKSAKSQYGLRAAIHASFKYGLPTIVVDSELNKRDQTIRLGGIFAEVPYEVIEKGLWKLTPDELKNRGISDLELPKYIEYSKRMQDPILWDKVEKQLDIVDYMPIYGMGVESVIPRLRQWLLTKVKPDRNSKFPQCLIVYDYLKLANIDELRGGKVNEWQVHGLNVARLHEFAQRYNVPILTFGQTNKELDTDLNCIAGAKRIVENVESASLLKCKTEEERAIDPSGTHFIRVFCARYGKATPIGHINFQIDAGMGQMNELGYSAIDFQEEKRKKLEEWKKKKFSKKQDDDDDE